MENLEHDELVEKLNLPTEVDDYVFEEGEEHLKELFVNESNYEGRKLTTDKRVPGSICNKEYYDYWKNVIRAPQFVLDTLKEGYKLPLREEPPASFCPNNRSALKQRDFMLAELTRLEKLGVISRVQEQPHLVLPLSVVFSKKLRLVVDASRALNPYIKDQKVHLESLDVAERTIRENDWQTKCDMDSGYWQLGLNKKYRKYVGLHYVNDDGSILFWVYNTLFLGVKSAVYIFTKMMAPLRTHLRSVGIRSNFYIDDVKILGDSERSCKENTQYFWTVCENSGWIINIPKSADPPTQSMEFLGLINCSRTMKFFVPEEKKEKIQQIIKEVLDIKGRVKARNLATVVGKLISCLKALGPMIRLLTRFCYSDISAAPSWNSKIHISEGAKFELNYLLQHFSEINGFPMRASLTQFPISYCAKQVVSDASAIGEFVYEILDVNKALLSRAFTKEECQESSTYRELQAFEDFYYSALIENYGGCNIVHYTDNVNCSRILLVGSKNYKLHSKVLKIFRRWQEFDIKVSVLFIPREDPRIMFADQGSRDFDFSDYSLDFDNTWHFFGQSLVHLSWIVLPLS